MGFYNLYFIITYYRYYYLFLNKLISEIREKMEIKIKNKILNSNFWKYFSLSLFVKRTFYKHVNE